MMKVSYKTVHDGEKIVYELVRPLEGCCGTFRDKVGWSIEFFALPESNVPFFHLKYFDNVEFDYPIPVMGCPFCGELFYYVEVARVRRTAVTRQVLKEEIFYKEESV